MSGICATQSNTHYSTATHPHTAAHTATYPHTATRTATHTRCTGRSTRTFGGRCNTLQHTATHCNTHQVHGALNKNFWWPGSVTHYEYNAKGAQIETDLSEHFVSKVLCVCCSMLMCVCETDLSKQFVAKVLCVCCRVYKQFVAKTRCVCCSVLQRVAACYSVLRCVQVIRCQGEYASSRLSS